jgi:hypothetical protein
MKLAHFTMADVREIQSTHPYPRKALKNTVEIYKRDGYAVTMTKAVKKWLGEASR